tara:strand:- start:839 stop:1138 length:300 start_codon:yes stop_codon:yes gene_type:complete
MNNVQTVDSLPSYISTFLKENMDQLMDIYDEGLKDQGFGCLSFRCSEEKNSMDVYYMNEQNMLTILQKESWEQLKHSMNEKKLLLINDLDKNAIFLIYV